MKSEFNPTGISKIGDPFVLHAKDGKYYMYATTHTMDCMGFKVWTSVDLKNWDEGQVCFELTEDSFASCDCWAPEVVEHQGCYIMHFTARWKKNQSLRIGVAVSDAPEGPFLEVKESCPLFDYGYAAIDGSVFRDEDGRNYLYYSRDCGENIVNKEAVIDGEKAVKREYQSHIYVVELSEDLLSVIGDPKFLFGPTEEYECIPDTRPEGDYLWNEGPFMVKVNGEYHLMYSGNFFASHNYAICAAKSDSPTGGFFKYEKPIATYVEGKVSGPGHNSVFTDDKGQMYCAYHVHTYYDVPGGNRQLFIDPLDYVDGKLTMEITY